jgi:glycosyltransferase involved in cell wall biosynthesis
MNSAAPQLAYLGAVLPVRSETFVYRELFELRRRGFRVHAVSVHPPAAGLGTSETDTLATEAIQVYGPGWMRLLIDALSALARRPMRSVEVLLLGLCDATLGRDVPLAGRPKLLIQCLAALALAHRTAHLQIDHVHAHMAHVPTSIAMYWARWLRVPFSFTGHAADLFRDQALLPAKLRRAAFVACISHWHREFYRHLAPQLEDRRLPIVRCGVDPQEFSPAHRTPGSPPQILAVGRLVEKKGFDRLVTSLAKLKAEGIDCRCHLIGDGPEKERLAKMCREASLEECCQLLGAQSNEQVRDAMRKADLFVLPCRATRSGDRDGIPVVLMEAMATGLPVISGDLATIRELITHQRTGWLVDVDQPGSLDEALRTLLADAALRDRLGAAARSFVADEFSLHKNVDRLMDALRCCCCLRGPLSWDVVTA